MSTPLSLFDELTHQTHDGFPVTALLTQLLQIVAHDACLAKRNLHSLYWTVSSVRDLCDETNALIASADTGDSWEAFNRYTGMILFLEEILLDFSAIVERESTSSNLPGQNTIQNDLDFIDAWRTNRKDLRLITKKLSESGYVNNDASSTSATLAAIKKHDDDTYFNFVKRGIASGAPNDVYEKLDAIQTAITLVPEGLPDDVVVYLIQTAMVVEILASARDATLTTRLDAAVTWEKIGRFLDLVELHAKDVSLSPEALARAWAELYAYLTNGVAIRLPGTYPALRALVAQIRRPYYAQSLALISGCVQLVPIFNAQKNQEMLTPLTAALDATTLALKAAAAITFEPALAFSEDPDVVGAVDAAKGSIKTCLEHYNIEPALFEENFDRSRARDVDCLRRLQTRFSFARSTPAAEDRVSLKVMVPGETEQATHTYLFEPSVTLSAVLWKEASLSTPEVANALRSKGRFQRGDESLNLDTEIGSIPEELGERSVTLFVAQ
ncbi:hypothetical protein C8R46DRAFT_1095836 [Mycena filopes]|nr:hypothetical protein C8R46DRAFT_1095836 [Mycena filopes]